MCIREKETTRLGHIAGAEGIKRNPNKVEAITKFKILQNVKEIPQFLALI